MKTINIDVTKGDEYLRSINFNRIDFMKIDVEGYEIDVLRGFIKNLGKIETVLLEFNHWCLSFYREMLPTKALFEISLYFDYIFFYDRATNRYEEINTESDKIGFLHQNMTKNNVDDLLCTNSGSVYKNIMES